MAHIEFTDILRKLSTDIGYRFRFFRRCPGNGSMSSRRANRLGAAGGLPRGAGDHLGGVFGRAASGACDLQLAVGGPARGSTFEAAVEEIGPLVAQRKRRGRQVCGEIRPNSERSLPENGAPVLRRERAARPASVTVEQAERKLREQDLTGGISPKPSAAPGLAGSAGTRRAGGTEGGESAGGEHASSVGAVPSSSRLLISVSRRSPPCPNP